MRYLTSASNWAWPWRRRGRLFGMTVS
jgi:hypothetical protein